MFPWPSFASFVFARDEQPYFGSDVGWQRQPKFSVQSPLGSAVDNITTLALGSLSRAFELQLRPERFDQLAMLLNVTSALTDWTRPTPDSRQAVLIEVTPVEFLIEVNQRNGFTERRIRTKLSFLSQ